MDSFMAPEVVDNTGRMQWMQYGIHSEDSCWIVTRNYGTEQILRLAKEEFRVAPVLMCGVCSTDLSLHRFPFPLPTVGGHELLVGDMDGGSGRWCVDINASHVGRGVRDAACVNCTTREIPSQCGARMTIGIDRLLGGFAPFIIAPRNCFYAVPAAIPSRLAVIAEPFAAALHVLNVVNIPHSADICVLGPKKLGFLIVLALKTQGYEAVSVVGRHARALDLCQELGAHRHQEAMTYDWVFDCTGTPDGFSRAVQLIRPGGVIHVKSTGGHPVGVVSRMTQLVVDEIALVAPHVEQWRWRCSKHAQNIVDVARFSDVDALHQGGKVGVRDAIRVLESDPSVDGIWADVFAKGISIHTSRCGDIAEALAALGKMDTSTSSVVMNKWITHSILTTTMQTDGPFCVVDNFPFCFVPTSCATNVKDCLKVMIEHK